MWFAVGVCYGRSKPLPYQNLFVSVIDVRFAVVAHNGQSRTPVPTNKVFVSPIEVGSALIVRTGGASPSPTNVNVRFGNRGNVFLPHLCPQTCALHVVGKLTK